MTSPSRRAAVLHSPRFQEHETGNYPERPERLRVIDRQLALGDVLAGRPEVPFGPASMTALRRVHDARYLDALIALAERGGGALDADTIVSPASWEVARLAAGAGVALVDAAIDGSAPHGFALTRPPGHHATPSHGMGFCLLNTVGIAAAHALARGFTRIMIVDWDVHHGNGTQDAFYEDDRVLYVSLHQWPLYPMTGLRDERGAGRGLGYTINLPLPPGRTDTDYLDLMDEVVVPAGRSYRPELIVISAGYDAHGADPLGGMRLTADGFGLLTERLAALADAVCDGRLVAVLEGGYDPPATAASVIATIRALDGAPETEVRTANRA